MNLITTFKASSKRLLPSIKTLLLTALAIHLTACQVTPTKVTKVPTYGDYYLWLKTLDKDELLQEIEQQKINKDIKSPDAYIYVTLLHSLPASPIYNPYTAKSLLNELRLKYVESRYNPTNLALITLLKDLLNEQLLTIQQYDKQKLDFNNSQNILLSVQKSLKKKNKQLVTQNNEIVTLKQQVALLQEQISQLHHIEQSINEHGN